MFSTLLARPRLLTTGAVLTVLAALAVHPTLARSIGADVWNVTAIRAEMRESASMGERLDDEKELVRQRIYVKEAIIAELIAGRTTLAEVTAKFTELNAERPEYVDAVRTTYPGATDEEKTAHNVIAFALARAPAKIHGALAERLGAELEQMFAPSGTH